MTHRARKRFGQHFLIDVSVVDALLRLIDPRPGEVLVEIGPGHSALTAPLVERAGSLMAIEVDRDLVARLRARWPEDQLAVMEADVLGVDFAEVLTLGRARVERWVEGRGVPRLAPGASAGVDPMLRVVGNLPYNISTPLLFHLMPWADRIRDQHFMLQREVVERMVALPGDSHFGRLSVMLQSRYRMSRVLDVPPEAFDPPPRVMSSVVRMRPLDDARLRQPRDPLVFERLVARAFEQRRKMIRRSLGAWAEWLDWEALGIAPTVRAQELSVDQFMDMADALARAGVTPPA